MRCALPLLLLALWALAMPGGSSRAADPPRRVVVNLGEDDPEPQAPAPTPAPAPPSTPAPADDDEDRLVPDPAAQAAFEAALRGERTGETAAALLQLARSHPRGDIAPEALFEAAQIFEERLAEPLRARDLYEEVATRYPQSRLSRRAQYRRDELNQGLRTGEAPLREFRDIVSTYHQAAPGSVAQPGTLAGPTRAATRLAALLRQHPRFALADQAHYLLGNAYREQAQLAAAQATFVALLQAYPGSAFAPRAEQALAELALQRRDFAGAEARFASLSRYGGPLWTLAAAEGVGQARKARLRYRLALLSLACVFTLGVLWALRARRRLWPPPAELWYYAPVAAFLCLVGQLVSGGSMARPLLGLSAGGVMLTWLSGSSARRTLERHGAPRALAATAGLGLRAVAALALCYLVLHYGQLTDLVLDTLRNGPEH